MDGIGNVVRPVHEFCFQGALLRTQRHSASNPLKFTPLAFICSPLLRVFSTDPPRPRILEYSSQCGAGEVQTGIASGAECELSDYPKRLGIAFETIRQSSGGR